MTEWQADVEQLMPALGRADPKDWFEAELVDTHKLLLRQRRALVLKLEVPKRTVVRGGRTFQARVNPTLCDFSGVLLPSLLPVFFDAKRKKGQRFAHSDATGGGRREHQWEALRFCEAAGMAAFYIIEVRSARTPTAALVRPSQIPSGSGVALLEDCVLVRRQGTGRWPWLEVLSELYPELEP